MKRTNEYLKIIDDYFLDQNINTFNVDKITYELDMSDILEFDFDLVELFKKSANDFISLIKTYLKDKYSKEVSLIVKNLHEAEKIQINEIRIDHTNNLYKFKGMIKRKSGVFPKIKSCSFLCQNPSCPLSEEVLRIPQIEDKIKKIKACPKCKSPVDLIAENKVDYQVIVLEELTEDMENINSQPKIIQIGLEESLTEVKRENKLIVGSKVNINGFVREKKRKVNNIDSIFSDFYIEGLNVELLEESYDDLKITSEEIQKFIEISNNSNVIEVLQNSTAPNLLGMSNEKLTALCSIVGGNEDTNKRSRLHSLFLGDPGKGKSKLLNFVKKLMPRTKYVSGEGSSGVGLTATAEKDEFTGGWSAEAGAIVQAHKGYLLLDELDKISIKEQTKLNTALEDGIVALDKASISVTLNAEATTIASANPKLGKFDTNKNMGSQIHIDKALLSRFDLIIFMLDTINEKEDQEIADFIFDVQSEDEKKLSIDELRKYLFYAKTIKPKQTIESANLIKKYYVELRKKTNTNDIHISIRQLEGLKRISEAITKLKLKKEVGEEEAKKAIELMQFSMKYFTESEILTGISNNLRSNYKKIEEVVLIFKEKKGEFTMEEILNHPMIRDNSSLTKAEVEKSIDKMKSESILFEPRKNFYKLM